MYIALHRFQNMEFEVTQKFKQLEKAVYLKDLVINFNTKSLTFSGKNRHTWSIINTEYTTHGGKVVIGRISCTKGFATCVALSGPVCGTDEISNKTLYNVMQISYNISSSNIISLNNRKVHNIIKYTSFINNHTCNSNYLSPWEFETTLDFTMVRWCGNRWKRKQRH